MRRAEARELFMQLLFQMEVQKDYSEEIKNTFIANHLKESDQLEYFNELHDYTTKHLKDIDEHLAVYSKNWKTERMAKVDLAVLRLAAAEILYMKGVPDSVAANEAVNLAKKFGGEDSGKFVNGLLGRMIREKNNIPAVVEMNRNGN